MIIGIMSDSHDNLPAIERAVEFFNKNGAELLLHAGDYVAPFVGRALGKFKGGFRGVFGNNDGERNMLRKVLGVEGDFLELEIEGLKIAMLHGTDERIVNALLRSSLYDVVVVGHTHKYEIVEVGGTILVNPGETCGYLTSIESVALLDTRERVVRIVNLKTEELLGAMSI